MMVQTLLYWDVYSIFLAERNAENAPEVLGYAGIWIISAVVNIFACC